MTLLAGSYLFAADPNDGHLIFVLVDETAFVNAFFPATSNDSTTVIGEDITAVSHELAESFADPFVNNATPIWVAPNGLCQNNLESGDVIEGVPNATFPMTMNGYTYHPQNEALLRASRRRTRSRTGTATPTRRSFQPRRCRSTRTARRQATFARTRP